MGGERCAQGGAGRKRLKEAERLQKLHHTRNVRMIMARNQRTSTTNSRASSKERRGEKDHAKGDGRQKGVEKEIENRRSTGKKKEEERVRRDKRGGELWHGQLLF